MCIVQALPALIGGIKTVTGAGALASTLQLVGTAISIGGAVSQGMAAKDAAEAQAAQIEIQKKQQGQLNSTKEQRARKQFSQMMSQQRAELVARGVSLDSPTAVFLGQTAAQEMTFEAQSIRQTGLATQSELSHSQRQLRAQGKRAVLKGGFSAAGTLLKSAPDLWPELLS